MGRYDLAREVFSYIKRVNTRITREKSRKNMETGRKEKCIDFDVFFDKEPKDGQRNLNYLGSEGESAQPAQGAPPSKVERIFQNNFEVLLYLMCIVVWSVMTTDETILGLSLKQYGGDIYTN